MNLLEFFLSISGVLICILALDVARSQKFSALHFFIFILVGICLVLFTIFPEILQKLGFLFGLQRGADLLVYSSILFLFYFSLILLKKAEISREDITKIVREIALDKYNNKKFNGDIIFIVPAFNESTVIRGVILSIYEFGFKNIVVVNDGSKDDTKGKLLGLPESIIVLHHFKNRGQGAAIETGFEFVRRFGDFKYICTFDSDGQHKVEDVKKFIQILDTQKNIDIVFGSRFKKGSKTNITLKRKILLKMAIVFTFFLSKIHLTDTHNGFRVFRSKIIHTLKITLDGMGHASEILDIVAQNKIPFAEAPVHIEYTQYSKSKGQNGLNAINIAIKLLWKKFFY